MGLGFLGTFVVSFLRLPRSRHLCLRAAAMKNHLPDRWTEYIPVGKRIPGTRFIAFKVPLQAIFDSRLTPMQRFSPADLISEVEKQNEQLGLIVDLTCTKRYYSPQELPTAMQYIKIFTIGHQVPSNDVIYKFKSVVKQFLSENADNDKLIGVHCTHGLNRTGYLVCRYMIDMLDMVPSDAIEKFNTSRGHSMERKNYLQDLLQGRKRAYTPGPPLLSCQQTGKPPGHAVSPDRPAPRMPPRMLGPRHYGPPVEQNLPRYSRNHQMDQHHYRHYYQPQDYWSVDEPPAYKPQHNGGYMAPHNNAQGFGPWRQEHNASYSRRRRHRRKSRQ